MKYWAAYKLSIVQTLKTELLEDLLNDPKVPKMSEHIVFGDSNLNLLRGNSFWTIFQELLCSFNFQFDQLSAASNEQSISKYKIADWCYQ